MLPGCLHAADGCQSAKCPCVCSLGCGSSTNGCSGGFWQSSSRSKQCGGHTRQVGDQPLYPMYILKWPAIFKVGRPQPKKGTLISPMIFILALLHPPPTFLERRSDRSFRWCIYRPAGDDEGARTAENLHLDVNSWTYAGLKPTEIESLRPPKATDFTWQFHQFHAFMFFFMLSWSCGFKESNF